MNRIKELRINSEISQKEFAIDLKVDQSTVSKWERDAARPSSAMAQRIAAYFHVSIDYLLGADEKQQDNSPYTVDEELVSILSTVKKKDIPVVKAFIAGLHASHINDDT